MGKIKYANDVHLLGIVGDYVKFGKAKNGNGFVSFVLDVKQSGMELYGSKGGTYFIPIVRFDSKYKKYSEEYKQMGLKRGMVVELDGWLHLSKYEKRGIDFYTVTVMARNLKIINTKEDKK